MNKKLVNACILCLIIIVGCILINTFRGKNNINEGFAPTQREPDTEDMTPDQILLLAEQEAQIQPQEVPIQPQEAAEAPIQPQEVPMQPQEENSVLYDDDLIAHNDLLSTLELLYEGPNYISYLNSLKITINSLYGLDTNTIYNNHPSETEQPYILMKNVDDYIENLTNFGNLVHDFYENIGTLNNKLDNGLFKVLTYGEDLLGAKTICDKWIKPRKKMEKQIKYINTINDLIKHSLNIKINKYFNIYSTEVQNSDKIGCSASSNIRIMGKIDELKGLRNDLNAVYKERRNTLQGNYTHYTKILSNNIGNINEWMAGNLQQKPENPLYSTLPGVETTKQPLNWCFSTEGVDNECLNDTGASYGCQVRCEDYTITLDANGEEIKKCKVSTPDDLNFQLYTRVDENTPLKMHSHPHKHDVDTKEVAEVADADAAASLDEAVSAGDGMMSSAPDEVPVQTVNNEGFIEPFTGSMYSKF
jgi:hypothetical protein